MNNPAYNAGVNAALANFTKQASAATPYVLAMPGAIAGGRRAHKKKNPIFPGVMSGALGSSLGGTLGGAGAMIAGMHAGKAYHNLVGSLGAKKPFTAGKTRKALLRRIGTGGEIGAGLGILGGGLLGYEYSMRRFERRAKAIEDHVLRKHNVIK